jgi:beta-galactosidase
MKMKFLFSTSVACLLLSTIGLNPVHAYSNYGTDEMFNSLPLAVSSTTFDNKGFIIDGKRTWIASAGIEYERMPRQMWHDRLLRLKRDGFNTIEIYTMWNYVERKPGVFDFTGNADLNGFLKLASAMGFYVVVRPGPYIGAEWAMGGLPLWFRFVDGLTARTTIPERHYISYVNDWYNQVMPIIADNEMGRNGSVVLLQLENECMNVGWGKDGASSPYYVDLADYTHANGVLVPYWFSGLNHSGDPSGILKGEGPWDSADRDNPFFSSEFYDHWIGGYGATDVTNVDTKAWGQIAFGGNGFNYYMGYGGSNFEYWNGSQVGSSYDYGSGVGESGEVGTRGNYYKQKRSNWFARSFQAVLENSNNATDKYAKAASNSSIKTFARKSPSGTTLFLYNSTSAAQTTKVRVNGTEYPAGGSLIINAGEIVPTVTDYPIAPGVKLSVAPTRIFGITQQGSTTTLAIYGQPGSPAELYFEAKGAVIAAGARDLSVNGSRIAVKTTYPSQGVNNYRFTVGGSQIRILAMSDRLIDDTYFVPAGGQNWVVVGPQYVGDMAMDSSGNPTFVQEAYWQNPDSNSTLVYGTGDKPITLTSRTKIGNHVTSLPLSDWRVQSGTDPASPRFDDSSWLSEAEPKEMGADGDFSDYCWYRTKFTVPSNGAWTIAPLSGGKADAQVWVDGVPKTADVSNGSLTVDLDAGTHVLAVYTSHTGLWQLNQWSGTVCPDNASTMNDYRGMSGPVYATSGNRSVHLSPWTQHGGPPAPQSANGWSPVAAGTTYTGPQMFQTTFTVKPLMPDMPGSHPTYRVVLPEKSMKYGSVWVNGHHCGVYPWRDAAIGVYLPECWLKSGINTLTVYDAYGNNPAGNVTIQVAQDESRDVLQMTATTNTGFSVLTDPPGLVIGRSSSASNTVTATVKVTPENGFTGPVKLFARGLPAGVRAYFNPPMVSDGYGSSVLTLTGSKSAALGISTISVIGKSADLSASTPLSLKVAVNAITSATAPTFHVAVSAGITIVKGGTVSVPVSVTEANGFTGPVTLSIAGLPSGFKASFSPAQVSGAGASKLTASSRLTFKAANTARLGDTPISVIGTSGRITSSITTLFTVAHHMPVAVDSSITRLLDHGSYTLIPQCATKTHLGAASTTNGAKAEIITKKKTALQQWILTKVGQNSYKLKSAANPNLCLEVIGGATTDGTFVDIEPDNGHSNQLWRLTLVYGNIYTLSPENAPGKVLDVPGGTSTSGTQVEIWSPNGGSNQQWAIGVN